MEISRRSRREERSVAGEPPLFFFSAEFVEAIFSLSLSLRFYVSKLVGFLVERMSKGYLNLNLSIY